MTCVNCGCIIGQQFVFQGVIVCGDCYKIVSHAIQRTRNELNMLFLTYTDMLRVALIKGQLRPPKLPPAGTKMPRKEFTRAFKRLMEASIDENHAKDEEDSDGTVQGVRGPEEDTRRELRRRNYPPSIHRRGKLRVLPKVQEDGDPDDRRDSPAGASQAPNGVDQTTRR